MSNFAFEQFLEFKGDPKASAAFLSAFDSGYLATLEGKGGVLDVFGSDSTSRATMFGYQSGQDCASESLRSKLRLKMDESMKEK